MKELLGRRAFCLNTRSSFMVWVPAQIQGLSWGEAHTSWQKHTVSTPSCMVWKASHTPQTWGHRMNLCWKEFGRKRLIPVTIWYTGNDHTHQIWVASFQRMKSPVYSRQSLTTRASLGHSWRWTVCCLGNLRCCKSVISSFQTFPKQLNFSVCWLRK